MSDSLEPVQQHTPASSTSVSTPSNPSEQPADQTPLTLSAPRPPLLVAFLYLATFGLYSSFWMVARMREFNKLQQHTTYRPWLWFFSPFFVLIQLVTLPKFLKQLQECNLAYGLKIPALQSALWILLLLTVSTLAAIEMKYEVPLFLTLSSVAIAAAAYGWAQYWFNQLKQQLTAVSFIKPRFAINVYEGIGIALGSLLWLGALYVAIDDLHTGEPLDPQQSFTVPEHHFEMPIQGDYWKADINEDDSSVATINGKLITMYFDLYHYGFDESLDSVSYWRLMQIKESLSSVKACHHERFFDEDKLSVVAFAYCKGKSALQEPTIMTVTVIDSPAKGVYELYGEFSAPKISYKQYENDILTMAKGLRAK